MTSESIVFGLLTVLVIVGTAVLIAGVDASPTNMVFIAVGGAVMVAAILAMAGYIGMMDEPEGHESGAGH